MLIHCGTKLSSCSALGGGSFEHGFVRDVQILPENRKAHDTQYSEALFSGPIPTLLGGSWVLKTPNIPLLTLHFGDLGRI